MPLHQYTREARKRIRHAVKRIESMPFATASGERQVRLRSQLPILVKATQTVHQNSMGLFSLQQSSWTNPTTSLEDEYIVAANIGPEIENGALCIAHRAVLKNPTNTSTSNQATQWVVTRGGQSTPQVNKSFFVSGVPHWTIADPTEQKTTFPDYVITNDSESFGYEMLTWKPTSSTTWSSTSTVAQFDASVTNYNTSGPYVILEEGRYLIITSMYYGLVRTTGAAIDPDNDKPIRVFSAIRYQDDTPGLGGSRTVTIGYDNITKPGDANFHYETLLTPPGWQDTRAHSLELSIYSTHTTTLKLLAGIWWMPVIKALCPPEYGVTCSTATISLQKLPS